MSAYRRFISYMYDYHQGSRGKNCGFVKIEVKNNRCTILFQLKNAPCQEVCHVYLYCPDEGAGFLFLRSLPVQGGYVNQKMEMNSVHIADRDIPFSKCVGILCRDEKGNVCSTCWSDSYKIPEYRAGDAERESFAETSSGSESIPTVKTSSVSESTSTPETFAESEPTSTLETSSEAKPASTLKTSSEAEPVSTLKVSSKAEPASTLETSVESESTSTQKISVELGPTSNLKISTDSKSASTEKTSTITDPESVTQILSDTEPISTIENPSVSESVQTVKSFTNIKSTPTTEAPTATQDTTPPKKPSRPRKFSELWEHMQKEFPSMDPFEDDAIVETIKISPSDLGYLQACKLDLGSNQFLLHGYKNYHHLLLGRIHGQFQYVIGIPGVFDPQEQFMAKMFGFPCFKPIRECRQKNGQFGYWMRCFR